ncbi:hypothetical protein NQ315_015396 [Exocentrus adspersus]|uniref:Transposase n=1 Tax=Exocentrus adspersus TaxID=1586481 RepID=A0AAV8V992_9CUCU|nr:hypothetical protein NQ315_015396 [Exocentrus adspersus]
MKFKHNPKKELEILLHIEANPQLSSRQLAITETSQSTVNRTTRKYKYHLYHIELHQELHDEDFERRTRLLRSNGAVNRHNMHYYALENPSWVCEIQNQNHWSINVWCGILHNRIIGPYFFNNPLNDHHYLQFIREVLPGLLQEINDDARQNMGLQQDGAPPHYHRAFAKFEPIF